ncbi:MAG: hypothetical protein HN337_06325 [Deltaproteobacteria bacterium]|nr:hypothetical protein [Deltaproteobacteria bacterium]
MKDTTRHLIFVLLTTLLLTTFVGCGGSAASAPPVDLPAPITGRITISNPDSSGNVTITGTAGAVDGGAMVMAVNEETAGAVSAILLDIIIKSAYATSFPGVCYEDGHACAVADAEGAFEMLLAAELGDSIVIGIIDENTGEFTSDIVRMTVGVQDATTTSETTCADYDVDGQAVDITIDPISGRSILLKQGSSTNTNQLVIGTSDLYTVNIDGCFAHSIAAVPLASGAVQLIVTSKDDYTVWTGTLDVTTVSDASSTEIDYQPMHVKFLDPPSSVAIIAVKTDDTMAIANISTSDLSLSNLTNISTNEGNGPYIINGLTQSLAMDFVSVGSNGEQSLGLIVTNDGNATHGYLTLFRPSDLTMIKSWTASQIEVIAPIDTKFFVNPNNLLQIGVLDEKFKAVKVFYLGDGANDEVSYTAAFTFDKVYDWTINYQLTYTAEVGGELHSIQKFALSNPLQPLDGQAIVAPTADGKVWIQPTAGGADGTIDTVADGDSLVAIILDNNFQDAFVADATEDEAISISDLIW